MAALTGKMTMAWEGDLAASTNPVELSDDMTKHSEIVFEVRSAAPTSNGYGAFYSVPVVIFKEYFDNATSPWTRLMCSPYDNQACYMQYVSDTSVRFIFSTTTRLRRIWFRD